jgi:hypothetical protein
MANPFLRIVGWRTFQAPFIPAVKAWVVCARALSFNQDRESTAIDLKRSDLELGPFDHGAN